MAIVTPTDCPKLVRNRFVIEYFGGVFGLSHCLLDFSVGVRAFIIGLSQISSFFSYYPCCFCIDFYPQFGVAVCLLSIKEVYLHNFKCVSI